MWGRQHPGGDPAELRTQVFVAACRGKKIALGSGVQMVSCSGIFNQNEKTPSSSSSSFCLRTELPLGPRRPRSRPRLRDLPSPRRRTCHPIMRRQHARSVYAFSVPQRGWGCSCGSCWHRAPRGSCNLLGRAAGAWWRGDQSAACLRERPSCWGQVCAVEDQVRKPPHILLC